VKNARVIRAATGSVLTARSWATEAPLRISSGVAADRWGFGVIGRTKKDLTQMNTDKEG